MKTALAPLLLALTSNTTMAGKEMAIADIQFLIGGAQSKLKADKSVRPLHLVVDSTPYATRSGDVIVIRHTSAKWNRIRVELDKSKPWLWKGLGPIPFADGLYFRGRWNERSWDYRSVYPDERLQSLLKRIRAILEEGKGSD